jgi:hypothetical protein
MVDLITRNLTDQSQNFGKETIISNNGGTRTFVNPATGQPVNRSINASAYDLQNSPLDNSFQLNSNQYDVATAMFSLPGVPSDLSNTFGAIAAVTAKSIGVSPRDVYKNGVMSEEMITNANAFRNATSQIGYNAGNGDVPYLHNLMLGAKIITQVI